MPNSFCMHCCASPSPGKCFNDGGRGTSLHAAFAVISQHCCRGLVCFALGNPTVAAYALSWNSSLLFPFRALPLLSELWCTRWHHADNPSTKRMVAACLPMPCCLCLLALTLSAHSQALVPISQSLLLESRQQCHHRANNVEGSCIVLLSSFPPLHHYQVCTSKLRSEHMND